MQKLSSLNLSFEKILIPLIIPGLTAFYPWFLYFLGSHQNTKTYFHSNSNITIVSIIFIALITGMVLENLGGRLEVLWLDSSNLKKDEDYYTTWNKFLILSFEKNEPIGLHYLRNILLRMKFELSMGLAMISMSIGLCFLNHVQPIFIQPWYITIFFILMPLIFLIYFLYEAKSSSQVLAKTRKLLVEEYSK